MKKQFKYILLSAALILSSAVQAGLHTPGYVNINGSYMMGTMNFKHNPNIGAGAYMRVVENNSIIEVSGTDGVVFNPDGTMSGGAFFACNVTQSFSPQLYADTMEIMGALKLGTVFYIRSSGIAAPEGEVAECNRVAIISSSKVGE
ncbi:hypothetical protein ACFL3U_02525 [Pseudomonadota bacterium]